MKGNPCDDAPALHHVQRKSEDIGAIAKVAFQLKVHPTKHQRKSNQGREHTAPHDQKVHRPSRKSALEDESLSDKVRGYGLRSVRGVPHKLLSLQVQLPSAAPVNARRRSLQPEAIAEDDRAKRNDARDGVAKKCGIVMFEIAGADDDKNCQQKGRRQRE